MKKDEAPLIVEQDFDRSASDVWNAITRIDEMRKWYFETIPDFKPEVGFVTCFVVDTGVRRFPHLWKVTEVDPPHKIVYNWNYECSPRQAARYLTAKPYQSASCCRWSCW